MALSPFYSVNVFSYKANLKKDSFSPVRINTCVYECNICIICTCVCVFVCVFVCVCVCVCVCVYCVCVCMRACVFAKQNKNKQTKK